MIKSPKPSISQAIMMVMLTVGITNHVFVIPALMQAAKRDAWFSVILSILPFGIFTCLLIFISNRTQSKSLHIWISSRFGTFPSYLFRAVLTIYFFTIAWFTLFDTITWTKNTFLPYTPTWATLIVLLGLCLAGATLGIKTIAVASGLLLPLVVVLGFYVGIANVEFKDYSLLFPILEFGWGPPVKGMVYACSGLFEFFLIMFIQPHLEKPLKKKHFFLLAVIITGLTIGPLTGAISEFNPYEASLQRYPAYEEWRIAGFGKYISQTDFFSIYQWLSGSAIRISFALFAAADLWEFKKPKSRFILLLIMAIALIPLGNYVFNDVQFQFMIFHYIFPGNLMLMGGFTLLLAIAVLIPGRKKGGSSHET